MSQSSIHFVPRSAYPLTLDTVAACGARLGRAAMLAGEVECGSCFRTKAFRAENPGYDKLGRWIPPARPPVQTIAKGARVCLSDGRTGANMVTTQWRAGDPELMFVRMDDGSRVRAMSDTVVERLAVAL
tara:strand:- start:250 stop:636 length:387 start_codon:yes stop_codon:yes gene_type:complete